MSVGEVRDLRFYLEEEVVSADTQGLPPHVEMRRDPRTGMIRCVDLKSNKDLPSKEYRILPPQYSVCTAMDGRPFYVDHTHKTTSWNSPLPPAIFPADARHAIWRQFCSLVRYLWVHRDINVLNRGRLDFLDRRRIEEGISNYQYLRAWEEAGVGVAEYGDLVLQAEEGIWDGRRTWVCRTCPAPATHAVRECFHMCLCDEHAAELMGRGRAARCPVCLGAAAQISRVYFC